MFFCYISAIPPGWSGGYLIPLQCTLHSSLNNNLKALPCMHNQLFSLKPTDISLLPASHKTPTYTYTAYISLNPRRCLHSLHLIYPPTYTYTACISFIPPHIPTQPASHLSSYMYLHCLHLIYPPTSIYTACISIIPPHIPKQPASHLPPHIPTQPASHLPPHVPTQPASHLSPYIYLHNLHLIYPPTCTYTACISSISPHIPTQPASHLSPHMYLHSLHLTYPPTYT